MKGPFTQCVSVCITCQWYFYFILFLVSCMCLCTWVRNLLVCLSLFVYFVNNLVLSNDYSQLFAIQNKSFYLYNICVYGVYLLCLCKFTHILFNKGNVFIYIYICMYIYICICICIYVYVYVCIYICLCICIYVCIYICIYVYVCVYICMEIHGFFLYILYLCVFIYKYKYTQYTHMKKKLITNNRLTNWKIIYC